MDDADDFVLPDWTAPVDLDAYRAAVPRDMTTRGMFFKQAINAARECSSGSKARSGFVRSPSATSTSS